MADETRNDGDSTATPLPPEALRWRCDPGQLDFETTAGIEPGVGVIGQETALEALTFGLATRASGQNIFVRGLHGTGRMTMLRHLLRDLAPPCNAPRDRCYVHNFRQPHRPRLVSLPSGRARVFRRRMDELADFVRDQLQDVLGGEAVAARRSALEDAAQERVKAEIQPFEESLREAGLALVTVPTGPMAHTAIFPLVEGKPVPPEEFQNLRDQGKIDDEQFEAYGKKRETFHREFDRVTGRVQEIHREYQEKARRLVEQDARAILAESVQSILAVLPHPEIERFLQEVVDDVVEHHLHPPEEDGVFTRRYRVNVIQEHAEDGPCPITVENAPTVSNLLGGVDRIVGPMGAFHSDHLMVRGGSLLGADGGYIILDVRDVLGEPAAWKILLRTLRTGRLDIVPPELGWPWLGQMIQPEPIDVDLKVVLIGDAEIFALLDAFDSDFPNLFKVLADFDSTIPRDGESVERYAHVLARGLRREEDLLPMHRTAVAALAEQGARIAGRTGKLTARFGRIADLAREASFLAATDGRPHVTGDDVRESILRNKRRADLPSRRFRELLVDGTILIATSGRAVGEINGLAVLRAGQLTAGFPARITATIGPGTAGVINIEREAALSGAIHTKGFYILGGLLRALLKTDHPLAFDASVAFEQTYGGIDGDSASGAEICCLLSALTEVPLRQDLAMTGAIDQVGNLLSIGAVNEKIEGFFDTCRDVGFTGDQGVIIPSANAGDLMLREDVLEACVAKRFAVYAVPTVVDALALLTGMPAGRRDAEGRFPEGSVLAIAVNRALNFWLRAAAPTTVVKAVAEAVREAQEEEE